MFCSACSPPDHNLLAHFAGAPRRMRNAVTGVRLLAFYAGSFSAIFLVHSCIFVYLFWMTPFLACVVSPAAQSALPVGFRGSLLDMSSQL